MVNTTSTSDFQDLFVPLRRLIVVDRVLHAQLSGNLQLLLGGRREDDLGAGREGELSSRTREEDRGSATWYEAVRAGSH